MGKFIDLTGKRFGKLTVISRCKDYTSPKGKTYVQWLCQCDCGNKTKVTTSNLKGHTKSCGCLNRENTIKRNLTHNLSKIRVYHIWQEIKKRCINKNCKCFERYGGRGITVYQEWLDDFMNFYNWAMDNGYSDDLTIDRIDVNGNYEPNNCRWVDNIVQANNKRNNRYITYNNETHTIAEWAKIYNINYKLLFSRLKKGWDIEKALTTKKLSYSECGKMAHYSH